LDGSYAHDSTAIAAVTFDTAAQRVRLVAHRIFVPAKDEPLDFGVEAALVEMRRHFAVQQILFDPFQMVALSQRMTTLGLPMESFSQTPANLEAASNNLAELIRHQNLALYPDPEIRLAMSRTVAVETPRGLRISKSKASHRIDIIAALSFAALAAVREGQFRHEIAYTPVPGITMSSVWDGRPNDPRADHDDYRAVRRMVAAHQDRQAERARRRWGRNWGGF
jgi:hypothetical protein